ncbi:MAG: S8 family serine peptidase, partial [Planctomycetota bacterium]
MGSESERDRRPCFEPLERRLLLDGVIDPIVPAAGEAADPAPSFVIDQDSYDASSILVRFARETDAARTTVGASAVAADTELFSVRQGWEHVPGLATVELAEGVSVHDALDYYGSSPEVIYAEPNYRVRVSAPVISDDPMFSSLWGMNNTGQTGGTPDADVDAPEAWGITTGDSSVVVAVIDTGIDYTHPDLAANMWVNPGEIAGNGIDDDANGFVDDIYGWDFRNNDNDPMDDNSHGTHVAGTVGAVGNNGTGVAGVNWDVRLMALKFLDAEGEGFISDAIGAIDYATMMKTEHGVDVVVANNSWGGEGFSASLRDAIEASGQAGIVFAAAAGNDGQNNDDTPNYPASYDLDNIISVAATNHRDELASFSNYGATSVDLAAPGVSIRSTVPGDYQYKSGTSMATPHVSGAVALLRSHRPGWNYQQVIDRILTSADEVPDLDGKTVTGARLNAYKALVTGAAGTVFDDANRDGVLDDGEAGLADWTVYADENTNGEFDAGEPSATTDARGEYVLPLAPGSYTLALIQDDGWGGTVPEGGTYSIDLTAGELVKDLHFGNAPTEVIVDNADGAGVAIVGNWRTDTFVSGYYDTNYLHDRNGGKGSKSVTFTPNIVASGQYEVLVWYPSSAEYYGPDVPVDILHTSGTDTVLIDQSTPGGAWESLGV